MASSRGIHSLSGDGYYDEARWPFGAHFYTRQRVQKWSPLMYEVETEKGIRFGSFRFGITRSRLVWRDSKEPRVENRRYGL
jgi:hypothetical protein